MKQLVFILTDFPNLRFSWLKLGISKANVASFRFWNSCFRPFAHSGPAEGGVAVTKTKKIQAKKVYNST